MPDQQLPPCGIGGTSVSGGPCSGTYTASQAGQDAFSTVDASPVKGALIAAAVIVAGLLFVVFLVRKVGGFFGGAPAVHKGGEPGTMEHDDAFWAARGREANNARPDAEFSDDPEVFDELDVEDDSMLEDAGDQLLLGGPDGDAEEKQGADLTDDEYDALEWELEREREEGGGA